MSLDCLTPKGQESIKHARRAIEILKSNLPQISFIETDQSQPADIDGVTVNNGIISSAYECKSRNFSLNEFRSEFRCEWLVTYDKIVRSRAIAESLAASYVCYVYSIKDDCVMSVRLFDRNGACVTPFRVEQTRTRENVNGGNISRANAFVDFSKMMIVREKVTEPAPSS